MSLKLRTMVNRCCGVVLLSATVLTSGTLSPVLHQALQSYQGALAKGATGSAEPFITTLVTLAGGTGALSQTGSHILFHKGEFVIAEIPLSQLSAVSRLPGVISMDDNSIAYPCLDKSAADIGVASARERFNLSGKGVLVGIIDSGIDWQHQDFRNPDGKTRIKCILDLSLTGNYYGGKIITEKEINAALQTSAKLGHYDYAGHGTHIAGIAAGDGSETGLKGTYCGMAPEADLVIVKASRDVNGSTFKASDQILALTFIDSVATSLGLPYVANLSFGGHMGAHDGTSTVERYIDQLVGANKPGKAIVAVAGNDGENPIHAFVRTGQEGASIEVNIPAYSPQPGSSNDYARIDGWYSGLKNISITLISPSGTTFGPVDPGRYMEKRGLEGSVYIWNGFYEKNEEYVVGANPYNGDREFYVDIGDAPTASPPDQGIWTLRFTGDATDIHAWMAYTTIKATFAAGSSNDYKIAIPGTAKNVICVGAYTTKEIWDDADGHHLTIDTRGTIKVGDIASFSSPGPARYSNPIKPDLTAPGQIIGSSYSEDAPPGSMNSIFVSNSSEYPNAFILADRLHALSSGTSMAAPHVAGVIALILQKYPNATANQIRDMLTATARSVSGQDAGRWGWGKLDAAAALQAIPGQETPSAFNLAEAYPNPFTQRTRFAFQLPIDYTGQTVTRITIYNILGQKVKTLLAERRAAGFYNIFWDGRDDLGYKVGSGIYLAAFEYGDKKQTLKITLLSGKE